MGKKSECIRVPILIRMDNTKHQNYYKIYDNIYNKIYFYLVAVIICDYTLNNFLIQYKFMLKSDIF